jgi:hypothetical protein
VISSQEDVGHENVESSYLLFGSGMPSTCFFSDTRYVRNKALKNLIGQVTEYFIYLSITFIQSIGDEAKLYVINFIPKTGSLNLYFSVIILV